MEIERRTWKEKFIDEDEKERKKSEEKINKREKENKRVIVNHRKCPMDVIH